MTKPMYSQLYRERQHSSGKRLCAQTNWDVRTEASDIQNDVNRARDDPYRLIQREMRFFGDYFDYDAAYVKAVQRLREGTA